MMKKAAVRNLMGAACLFFALAGCAVPQDARPNVLLIMTDDQGYGDVGFNGNPVVKTPILDRLASESVVFSNFYAQPVCSPTRASLMTGLHALRTGVYDTQGGVSILRSEQTTLAEILRAEGYRTGLFGKWHLGDNAPARPQDQGFDKVLTHAGGMIGMPYNPPLGRSYFDPILIDDGRERQFEGFAPDLFADSAIEFVADDKGTNPFFAFLSFNTPHHPLTSPDRFADPFRNRGLSEETSRFYGMIANIDWNIGRVLNALEAKGVLDDTLVIFVGDNGTSSLHRQSDLWETGLRGRKTHVYENGIKVPMVLKLPSSDLRGEVREQVGAIEDIVPTVLDVLEIDPPVALDGVSLLPAARDPGHLMDRPLFFYFHRGEVPEPYRNVAVRRGNWKLVQPVGRGGEPFSEETARFELYDLAVDPKEQMDLAMQHPAKVEELKTAYEDWFNRTYDGSLAPARTWIGSDRQNPVTLTRQDWRGGGLFDGDNGVFELDVRSTGQYRMTFRWSALLNDRHEVTIRLGKRIIERTILPSEMETRIESIELPAGAMTLEAWIDIGGQKNGFESVEIERLGQ